jgi:hypothetical protein
VATLLYGEHTELEKRVYSRFETFLVAGLVIQTSWEGGVWSGGANEKRILNSGTVRVRTDLSEMVAKETN